MPSLITEEPDSYNINYYYSKYRDHYSIRMTELNLSKLRVLLADINSKNVMLVQLKRIITLRFLLNLNSLLAFVASIIQTLPPNITKSLLKQS